MVLQDSINQHPRVIHAVLVLDKMNLAKNISIIISKIVYNFLSPPIEMLNRAA